MLKKYSNNRFQYIFFGISVWCAVLFFFGCSSSGRYHGDQIDSDPKDPAIKQNISPRYHDSRRVASDSLTREGITLYKKGDIDGAIRTFERAVGIHPYDGISYYYLAESWMIKNNYRLAAQYNKLAEIHLRSTQIWSDRIAIQKRKIEKGTKRN